MKYIILSLALMLELFAFEDISYKCYGKSYIQKGKNKLAQRGEIKNHTKIELNGNGKVIFFYPCGAPSIVKVIKPTPFNVEHQCKNNSIVKSLVISFFDKWFSEDEKITISASSRSASQVSRGNNYFIINKKYVESIDIPIYDEDAKYVLNINDKDHGVTTFIGNMLIQIPTSLLANNGKNRIKVYEDDIKVYDFSVEYINKKLLEQKYSAPELSTLERALSYEKESNSKLYTNGDISYLLQTGSK